MQDKLVFGASANYTDAKHHTKYYTIFTVWKTCLPMPQQHSSRKRHTGRVGLNYPENDRLIFK